MNSMNTPTTHTIETTETSAPPGADELTPERLLAGRGIPQKKLKEWRASGEMREGEHYTLDGRSILLTAAGVRRARELAGLDPQPPPEPERVAVRAQCAGAMPRVLRCKLPSGVMVSVRLTAPRVFAAQFPRGAELRVTPTETEGIYVFDGAAPRRCRM